MSESLLVCPSCRVKSKRGKVGEECPRCGIAHLVHMTEYRKDVHDPFLGKVLADKYLLLGILGTGGMGRVYKGLQHPLGRRVAIKMVKLWEDSPEESKERFLREARTIACLDHPNIVTLYDFGVEDGDTMYMVMEYVQGVALSTLFRKRKLDPILVLWVAEQVLLALKEAHREKVVHRDLKPDNILIVEREEDERRVKVLDFGIAKAVTGERKVPMVTKSGLILGTPRYMPPEQIKGIEVDNRADLYSLGIIIYQGVAGEVPFDAPTAYGIMQKQVEEQLGPFPEGFPGPVMPLVTTALAKQPAGRFTDAATMLDAVRKVRARLQEPEAALESSSEADIPILIDEAVRDDGEPTIFTPSSPMPAMRSGRVPVEPAPPLPARYVKIAGMVALALVLLGSLLYLVAGRGSTPKPGPTPLAPPPVVPAKALQAKQSTLTSRSN